MSFICKRCNSQFSNKFNLKSHLLKNIPCEFIESDFDRNILIDDLYQRKLNDKTFDCEYCNKKFNHTSTKTQHKKICKSKPLDKITILENTVEKLISKIEILEAQPKNTTNNNTQININGIKLRDFGRENMEAIPQSLISTLFMDLRFRELLAQLHCDPNYPENQNIRIKSIKKNIWKFFAIINGTYYLLIKDYKNSSYTDTKYSKIIIKMIKNVSLKKIWTKMNSGIHSRFSMILKISTKIKLNPLLKI